MAARDFREQATLLKLRYRSTGTLLLFQQPNQEAYHSYERDDDNGRSTNEAMAIEERNKT
jgi:hypothetical protein